MYEIFFNLFWTDHVHWFYGNVLDKQLAKKEKMRIPESRLFRIAILGGSLGVLFGMYTFRHKTLHKQFTIGIPAILIAQIALVVFIFVKFIA